MSIKYYMYNDYERMLGMGIHGITNKYIIIIFLFCKYVQILFTFYLTNCLGLKSTLKYGILLYVHM